MLSPLDEADWLPEDRGLADRLRAGGFPQGPGAWQEIEPGGRIGRDRVGPTHLVALRDVLCDPLTGALLTPAGQVPRAPLAETADPAAAMALLRQEAGAAVSLDRALLFSPAGRGNYGHFIFDALTGLRAARVLGLTDRFAPITPPLCRWQRDLLGLTGDRVVSLLRRPAVLRIRELVYTTTMDHYLQRAGALLAGLAGDLGRPAQRPAAAQAVYLARGLYTKRLLLGEAALLARLRARGVRIVQPHRMSVAAQRDLMARTHLLIAPSGAALANMVFLPPGARVIELRPETIAEPWSRVTATTLGLHLTQIDTPARRAGEPGSLRADLMQAPRRLLGRACTQSRVDPDAVMAAYSVQ